MFLFNHDYLAFFGNQIYDKELGRDAVLAGALAGEAVGRQANPNAFQPALARVLHKFGEICRKRERQEQLQPKMENRRRVIWETYPDIPDVPGMELPPLPAE